MRWPWISRSEHQREVVRVGESYRWQLDEAKRKIRHLEQSILDGARIDAQDDLASGDRIFVVRLHRRQLMTIESGNLAEWFARELTIRLSGWRRDYRPDLRTPDRLPL